MATKEYNNIMEWTNDSLTKPFNNNVKLYRKTPSYLIYHFRTLYVKSERINKNNHKLENDALKILRKLGHSAEEYINAFAIIKEESEVRVASANFLCGVNKKHTGCCKSHMKNWIGGRVLSTIYKFIYEVYPHLDTEIRAKLNNIPFDTKYYLYDLAQSHMKCEF
jgi:hypothetical protein